MVRAAARARRPRAPFRRSCVGRSRTSRAISPPRARALADSPEIARSLSGGGIAVERERLFTERPPGRGRRARRNVDRARGSARQRPRLVGRRSGEGSRDPPGRHSRGALDGDAHGARPLGRGRPAPVRRRRVRGPLAARRGAGLRPGPRPRGSPPRAGSRWLPTGPRRRFSRRPRAARPSSRAGSREASFGAPARGRGVALALVLALAFALVAFELAALSIGAGLALAFLGAEAAAGGARRLLAEPRTWVLAAGLFCLPIGLGAASAAVRACARPLRLALAYALFGAALVAAHGAELPDLGAPFPITGAPFLELVALAALLASALAIGASARVASGAGARMGSGRRIAVTLVGLVAALLVVDPSPAYRPAVAAACVLAFEAWRRTVAAAPEAGALGPFRLAAGTTLLLLLVAAPVHENAHVVEAYRVARAIRLPSPDRISPTAVVAVLRAVDRVERFDLARELPAPDRARSISRIWPTGCGATERRGRHSDSLIAYEVFDRDGLLRSRFSLIPEVDAAGAEGGAGRSHRAAPRRDRPAGRRALRGRSGLGTRRRLGRRLAELGSSAAAAGGLPAARRRRRRPLPRRGRFSCSTGRTGRAARRGPTFPPETFDRVRRRAERRARPHPLPRRGALGRAAADARRLPARRDSRARSSCRGCSRPSCSFPAAGALYLLGGVIVLVRALARPAEAFATCSRAGARTFRGRLVALFVLSVMVPLLAVTFFLRDSITTRSRQDTARARAHRARDRPAGARRLPAVGAPRRAGAWASSTTRCCPGWPTPSDSTSPCTRRRRRSRRPRGATSTPRACFPERVPGSSYVAVGLGEARETTDARILAGRPYEELTTALSAVPGVPGVRSPVLLSLLLLPQQRAAEAEAAQLTAAVTAFALLVFLVSAAVAGRLARPRGEAGRRPRGGDARGRARRLLAAARRASRRGVSRARSGVPLHVAEPPRADDRSLAGEGAARDAALPADRGRRRVRRAIAAVLLANPAAARLSGGRVDGATLDEVFPGRRDAAGARRALALRRGATSPRRSSPGRGSAGASSPCRFPSPARARGWPSSKTCPTSCARTGSRPGRKWRGSSRTRSRIR